MANTNQKPLGEESFLFVCVCLLEGFNTSLTEAKEGSSGTWSTDYGGMMVPGPLPLNCLAPFLHSLGPHPSECTVHSSLSPFISTKNQRNIP